MEVLSIAVAAFSAFMIGGIWYGPLFLNMWKKENGFDDTYLSGRNIPMVFALSFILSVVTAAILSKFVSTSLETTLMNTAFIGLIVVASYGVTYLFEKRSLRIWLINAGYMFVSFIVMGLILHFI